MASFAENIANVMAAMKGKKGGGSATQPIQSNQSADIQRQLTGAQMGANQQQATNQALVQEATRQDNQGQYDQQLNNIYNKKDLNVRSIDSEKHNTLAQLNQKEEQNMTKLATEKQITLDNIYSKVTSARSDMELQAAQNDLAIYAQVKAFSSETYMQELNNAAELEMLNEEHAYNMAWLEKSHGAIMKELLENFDTDVSILDDQAKMGMFLQNLSDADLIRLASDEGKAAGVNQAITAGKNIYTENKDDIHGLLKSTPDGSVDPQPSKMNIEPQPM